MLVCNFCAHGVAVMALIGLFCSAVEALAGAATGSAPGKITVCDGNTAGAIGVPAGASPILLHAADVMQQGIETLSGRRPKLVTGNPEGCALVLAAKSPPS